MRKVFFLLLLFCTPAFGQISLDSGSPQNSGNQTTATSYSFNLTIGSGCANPVLFAGVGISDNGTPVTSTLTYNGTSLTQVRLTNNSGITSAIWELINPTHDGAAHSLAVTLSGAPATGSSVAAWAFCGVNQSTPVDVSNGATGSSTAASVSITTTINNDWYVVVGIAGNSTTITPFTNGETTDWTSTSPNNEIMGHKGPLSTGTTSPAATVNSGGGIWSITAVALAQVGGVAGTTGVNKKKKLEKLIEN